MKNVAEFTIIGRVGRIGGESVTRVTIASNYRRKDQDGAWSDDPYWNQIVVFAEDTRRYIAEQVGVGDLVIARGRVRQSSYEKDGETRYAVDLVCSDLGLLAAKQPVTAEEEPA